MSAKLPDESRAMVRWVEDTEVIEGRTTIPIVGASISTQMTISCDPVATNIICRTRRALYSAADSRIAARISFTTLCAPLVRYCTERRTDQMRKAIKPEGQ